MNIAKKKILVLVAHTDDESFGCGGFLKKLKNKKNKIYAISFTDGVGSRDRNNKYKIKKRKDASEKASKILGFKWLAQFNFPDNQLDKVSILEITKIIEKYKNKIKPDILLTHNFSDLNVDHRIIAEAALTAFRPEPKQNLKKFITFEVPSATDYRMLKNSKNFTPNFFVDVGNTMGFKIKAIKAYKEEIKPKPHSRSLSGVKNLNRLRGNQSGLNYAEAFEIIREISK